MADYEGSCHCPRESDLQHVAEVAQDHIAALRFDQSASNGQHEGPFTVGRAELKFARPTQLWQCEGLAHTDQALTAVGVKLGRTEWPLVLLMPIVSSMAGAGGRAADGVLR